jgi:predicted dehydrogenase
VTVDSNEKIKVAIVGFGYWGPNLARNFSLAEGSAVSHICDLSDDRLERAGKTYPLTTLCRSIDDILRDPTVDVVALATPVGTHHRLALRVLAAGKHVFIEKPLAASRAEALEILAAAQRQSLKVFVDHTFVFTPAVQKMRELLVNGVIGCPMYYDSIRVNLGLFQHDVNVVWDLVTHDVAILDFLLDGRMPQTASCTGVSHFDGQPADLAYLTLQYDGNFIAHINVNWLAPVKIRQVLLCGDRRMLVYDDNSASEKIKVYDSGVSVQRSEHVEDVEDVYEMLVQYRTGDMHAPRLDTGEALAYEAENVAAALRGVAAPVCDGLTGLRVVSILEAADASLRSGGQPVPIPSTEAATSVAPLQSSSGKPAPAAVR